jgi:hypothetical protein
MSTLTLAHPGWLRNVAFTLGCAFVVALNASREVNINGDSIKRMIQQMLLHAGIATAISYVMSLDLITSSPYIKIEHSGVQF